MSKYNFYYDETYQSGSMSIDKNGKLSLFSKGGNDFYLGIFVGFQRNQNKLEQEFLAIENKYKPDGSKEFKGGNIPNDNFKHGFGSIEETYTNFYNELFDFLLRNKAKIKIVCISRTELLLRNIISLENVDDSLCVNEIAFFYSLTKFFQNYQNQELEELLSSYCGHKINSEQFRNELIKILTLISNSCNSKNKKSQQNAFEGMKVILHVADIKNAVDKNDLKFKYNTVSDSFIDYINESKIDSNEINLFSDVNSHVIKFLDNYPFHHLEEVNLANSFGIRIADHLASFFGKIAFKASKFLRGAEKVDNFDNINTKEFNDINWLEKEWFEIDYKQFQLAKKVARLLIGNDKPYWTITTLSYNDQIFFVCSYLRYLNLYNSYGKYNKITNHYEKGNKYLALDLNHSLSKLK